MQGRWGLTLGEHTHCCGPTGAGGVAGGGVAGDGGGELGGLAGGGLAEGLGGGLLTAGGGLAGGGLLTDGGGGVEPCSSLRSAKAGPAKTRPSTRKIVSPCMINNIVRRLRSLVKL